MRHLPSRFGGMSSAGLLLVGCLCLPCGEALAEVKLPFGKNNPARPNQPSHPNPPRVAKGRSVPLDEITGPHAERVREILESPVIYRDGPTEAFPCDPRLMTWLLEHPAWVAEMWRLLGFEVSPVEMLDDGYQCHEGKNATARFHVVLDKPEMRILYCVGESRRPPFPGKLHAELVLVNRYRYVREPDGQYHLVQKVEGYASATGETLQFCMKMARGTCDKLVDRCLRDMMVYFNMMAQIVTIRPMWTLAAIDALAARLSEEEAQAFRELVISLPPPDPALLRRVEYLAQEEAKSAPNEQERKKANRWLPW